MIFLTGPHGAGKTRSSAFLSQHNFYLIDLGPMIRAIHQAQAPDISFKEWVLKGEEEYGPDFTNQLLTAEVNRRMQEVYSSENPPQDILIAGSRSVRGLRYLQDSIIIPNHFGHRIVYIDAPFDLLWARYNAREGKMLTKEEFELILLRDKDMGIDGLREIADTYILNDGEESLFDETLDNLFFNDMGYRKLSENIDNGVMPDIK